MLSIIFALIAFVGWGTGDVFGGLIARKIKGYSAAFWLYVFSFIISTLCVPFFWHQLTFISSQMWLLIIILNIIGTIPMVALYQGISIGNASIVGTIAASFAAITVIFSVIFLGDKLSLFQTIPIVIIFIGLILSSIKFKSLNLKSIITDKGIPYGLTAMFFWGIYYTFIRIPIREVGWFWPSYLCFISIPIILFFMRLKKIKLEKLPNIKTIIISFLNALLLTIAAYSYNFAIIKGQTSIIAPITGSYPVLFAIISYFVFKDRLSKQQILGIVISLFGIIILSFLSI